MPRSAMESIRMSIPPAFQFLRTRLPSQRLLSRLPPRRKRGRPSASKVQATPLHRASKFWRQQAPPVELRQAEHTTIAQKLTRSSRTGTLKPWLGAERARHLLIPQTQEATRTHSIAGLLS